MSGRIGTHIRSNVVGYVAVFLALSGTAAALPGTNTVFSDDITNGEVRTPDLDNAGVTNAKLAASAVNSPKILNQGVKSVDIGDNNVQSADIRDDTLAGGGLGALDLATDSVGSSEIAADNVGSSEIAAGVVGADELDTVHEHFSAATNIVDTTAHDGAYGFTTATVTCGVGEDLLSVSLDWIDDNGHNETVFGGVDSINRTGDDSAVVRTAFDGGGGAANPAQFQAVATCIF